MVILFFFKHRSHAAVTQIKFLVQPKKSGTELMTSVQEQMLQPYIIFPIMHTVIPHILSEHPS